MDKRSVLNKFARQDIKPVFAESNIPIAFSTDSNYLPYVAVAVNSLVANTKSGNLDVFILHDGLDCAEQADFLKGVRNCGRLSVRFVDVGEAVNGTIGSSFVQTGHISRASLFRLFLPEILAAYERAIHLDADLIVCRDIVELFESDLHGCLLGAVRDYALKNAMRNRSDYYALASEYGFSEWDEYINSGVLVMDLAALRESALLDVLLTVAVKASRFFCDQDALNFICKGRIRFLDPKWNVLTISSCYEKQFELTGGKFGIVHFAGNSKPWKTVSLPQANLWWENVCDMDFAVALRRRLFGVANTETTIGEGIAVSVIIPVYNAETYLAEMLFSLSSQTLRNVEIICVDDGSTDGSRAICERFSLWDRRIRVVAQENSGAAIARNRGIAEAKGRWLFFADADDFCRPDMLSVMVENGEANNADIVVAGYYAFDQRIELVKFPIRKFSEPGVGGESSAAVNWRTSSVNIFSNFGLAPWNKLYRADFIGRHGIRFHQTPPTDDVYFVLAAFVVAETVSLAADSFYYYRSFLTTSQMGEIDRNPTNFLVALKEVHDLLDGYDQSLRRQFLRTAIFICFDALFRLKTIKGFIAAYQAMLDGGIENLFYPDIDVSTVDLGVYRRQFELFQSRAGAIELMYERCRDVKLNEARLSAEKVEFFKKNKSLLAERDAARNERNQRIEERNRARQERDRFLAERDAARKERDQRIEERDRARQERDRFLAERDAARKERNQRIEERDRARQERDRFLAERDAARKERNQRIEERDRARQEKEKFRAALDKSVEAAKCANEAKGDLALRCGRLEQQLGEVLALVEGINKIV